MEISISAHPVAHEALSAFLFDLGCDGVVSEDFGRHEIKAYLPSHGDTKDFRETTTSFMKKLGEIFPELPPLSWSVRRIEDRDWTLFWRRFFRPEQVTQKLLVVPAWETAPHNTESTVIKIDPGPAFGTGGHPTTRLCLEAMERLSPKGSWTMLDVGTGSGILASYGAKLGAGRVVGLDTDPEAVRWAGRNISLNGLCKVVELSSEPIEKLTGRFSLLAANLTIGTILELLPIFPALMEPDGRLILSGILRGENERIAHVLPGYGLREFQTHYREEWACVIAGKRRGR